MPVVPVGGGGVPVRPVRGRVAARAGTGIKSVKDLRGKKVGVTFASTGDLYLRTVLEKNGITTRDYKRINTRPPSLVSVLDTGGVDAIVAWEPNLTRAIDKVKGANLVIRVDHPLEVLIWLSV